jgi:hypothetical protein
MSHGLETLNLELQCIALLCIRVPADCAHNTAHEARLWFVRQFALDGSESTLLGEEHVIGSLYASLFSGDV